MKTPITYWGGKQNLASLITSIIPPHTTYCEPFLGGGAVFFRKEPSTVEIINDLNALVVNFYEQSKTNFDELQSLIQATLHSRRRWRDALVMYENPHLFTPVQRAWAFYVVTNQGYSGKIGTWGFGTSTPSCEKRLHNRREMFTDEIRQRLERVQIECNDALYLLRLRDTSETFFYIDPPYFNSNMGHYGGYTEGDFEQLLQHCSALQGKFLLSSYPSDVLDKYVQANGWHQIQICQQTSASPSRKKKTEVLTSNYPISLPSV